MKLVTCARWGLTLAFLAVVTSLVWAHGNKPWPAPKEAIDRQNPVTAIGGPVYSRPLPRTQSATAACLTALPQTAGPVAPSAS